MNAPSICPDCGRNVEFILHEDGCPMFGMEVEQFLDAHDAEVASWPESARKAVEDLNAMHAHLFGKLMRQRRENDKLKKELEQCRKNQTSTTS